MIAYLILTNTLTAAVAFTLGFRMKPHTPPPPGCPCRDQAALDAQFMTEQRARFDKTMAPYDTRDGAA